jgi:hypothetical protein
VCVGVCVGGGAEKSPPLYLTIGIWPLPLLFWAKCKLQNAVFTTKGMSANYLDTWYTCPADSFSLWSWWPQRPSSFFLFLSSHRKIIPSKNCRLDFEGVRRIEMRRKLRTSGFYSEARNVEVESSSDFVVFYSGREATTICSFQSSFTFLYFL